MNKAIIITTINQPSKAVINIANGCKENNIPFIIIGDKKTPQDFKVNGGHYFDIDEQIKLFPEFSESLPLNHYARKNIGYLIAHKQFDVDIIHETDDDNIPLDSFWRNTAEEIQVQKIEKRDHNEWCNIYSFFTTKKIWPRGFPLEKIQEKNQFTISPQNNTYNWQIIQGLADENPDVDAVYRLTCELPIYFDQGKELLLEPGLWCPFNSQNTLFKKEAFPLLYLPSFCSFRMTDIWRSFIAQRILWGKNQGLVFTSSTVYQERNEHNLLKDFEQEVVGYLGNDRFISILDGLNLTGNYSEDMLICYSKLIEEKFFPVEELDLLKLWLKQIR